MPRDRPRSRAPVIHIYIPTHVIHDTAVLKKKTNLKEVKKKKRTERVKEKKPFINYINKDVEHLGGGDGTHKRVFSRL